MKLSLKEGRLGKLKPEDRYKLSPSTVNLFNRDKSLFVLKYLYGISDGGSIYTVRGTVVEEAVNKILKGDFKLKEAKEWVIAEWDEQAFEYDGSDAFYETEANLPDFVDQAYASIIGQGNGFKQQTHVVGVINNLPVHGYLDYELKGRFIDMKTTNTLPKCLVRGEKKGWLPAAKKDNMLQQVTYAELMPWDVKFSLDYVAPDGYYIHNPSESEVEYYRGELKDTYKKVRTFLEQPHKSIMKNTIPIWNKINRDFYWGPKTKEAAQELWGDMR